MSAEATVKIIVKAIDKTGGTLNSVQSNMSKIGKAAGAAALGATVVAGAAIAGVAVKGVNAFIDFEDQINEVFTLLPGISEQAMGAMRDDVLEASVAMGRLPEEVIPALYQSLSAGVPAGNVFEFLDVAHKAALGGVTELETAVDGITSVVNAYGGETISATEASDLMFTAVRLGKTTFGELSASLSNVTPIASAMGVQFGDVTAALAAMTSQGTPTAQATVQMRALMQELGTEGTKVAGIFEGVAGQTFLEFIAEGNNVADALSLLEQQAEATGMPVQDMFGNVRAGLGALQLTGKGAETFAANLEAMGASAGATDTAFNTMNTGIKRTIEVLQAQFETTLIRVGEALSPVIRMVGEKLLGAMDKLMPIIDGVVNSFGFFIQDLENGASPLQALQGLINRLVSFMGLSESQFENFGETLNDVFSFITDTAVPAVQEFIAKVQEFAEPIVAAITNFVSFKDVLMALGVAILAFIIPVLISIVTTMLPIIATVMLVVGVIALLRNAWENNWGGIQEKTQAVLAFIQSLISSVIGWVRNFWSENGEAIMTRAQEIWTGIRTAIDTAITAIRSVIMTVVTAIRTFWDENGEAIRATAERIWNAIRTVIETVIANIKSIAEAFMLAFKGDWRGFGEKLREAWDRVWNLIKDGFNNIVGTILTAVSGFILDVIAKFQDTDWAQVGKDILQGIANGVGSAVGILVNAAKAAASAALDAIKGFFGISSPSKVFAEVGVNLNEGLVVGLERSAIQVARVMEGILRNAVPSNQLAFETAQRVSFPIAQASRRAGPTTNNQQTYNLYITTTAPAREIIDEFQLMEAKTRG